MNAKRIVFVHFIALNETLLRLYPIDALTAAGLQVEYWDLSALFGHPSHGYEFKHPASRRFDTWDGFEDALRRADGPDAFFIVGFAYAPDTMRAWRALSGTRATLASVLVGLTPPPGRFRRHPREYAALLRDPRKIASAVLKRAALGVKKLGWARDADVVFGAGNAAREAAGRARVVPINHCDYDDWLLTPADEPSPAAGRYAVYLDEFMPFHPDLSVLGIRRAIDPVRYYARLNEFFGLLEKKHGVKIVVAAHPKSSYRENPFARREIFHGSTRALVRGCEFALTTFSNSGNYAVLARRPLIFFSSDEIALRYHSLRVEALAEAYANALGRKLANIDRLTSADLDVPPVDAESYDAYRHRYIVSPEAEGRVSRDIWREFLLN